MASTVCVTPGVKSIVRWRVAGAVDLAGVEEGVHQVRARAPARSSRSRSVWPRSDSTTWWPFGRCGRSSSVAFWAGVAKSRFPPISERRHLRGLHAAVLVVARVRPARRRRGVLRPRRTRCRGRRGSSRGAGSPRSAAARRRRRPARLPRGRPRRTTSGNVEVGSERHRARSRSRRRSPPRATSRTSSAPRSARPSDVESMRP